MTTSSLPSLRIALEWYLNPDHLPLLWAKEKALADRQLAIELIAPDDHYDGFVELADGQVDALVNEPLHLLEKQAPNVQLRSLGTFFHTDGGVLISHQAQAKLKAGEKIEVSSPVSNPVTDGLCREILTGFYQKQGIQLKAEQISVYEGGFDHVENLQKGADAAWLAFANIEGVHVKQLGLPVDMVTTTDGGVPGFSALELIGSRQADADTTARLQTFVSYLNAAVPALQSKPDEALALWYRASNERPSELTQAMVNDTLSRFVAPVRPDASRWRGIYTYMQKQGSDVVAANEFEAIFNR